MGIQGNELLEESIEKIFENEMPDNLRQNDLKQESGNIINTRNLIKNVNNQVLIDFLSPEVSKNEASKRQHKYILIILLAGFIIIQFLSVYNISHSVIKYATSSDSNIDIINSLLTFVSAYITSVVVELIAILKYIVENVFDTSIVELVKIFKETNKEVQEQD